MSDVFLCHPRRSAVGRLGGSLSGVRPDNLAAPSRSATRWACPAHAC